MVFPHRIRRPISVIAIGTFGPIVFAATPALAQSDLLTEAFSTGKVALRMHGRVELVDDEANTLDDASGFTLRTYLGYETGEISHWSGRIAVENVTHIVDDFNVPGYPSAGYDVIADPSGTEIDEAFIKYTGFSDTTLKYGRQYVTYRPAPLHRFIGTVPWRQNWQSMDAFTVENSSIKGLKASYAYVYNVNRIFGDSNPNPALSNAPMKSHLINLQYADLPFGSLEGFYYRLDYDNDELPAPFTDRETFGAKLQGKRSVSEGLSTQYLIEAAHQRAIAENPTAFDSANQYRVELGLSKDLSGGLMTGIMGKVGYEVLESDNGISFSTPLATVHAFQGWADRFIGFPGAGVKDAYAVGIFKFPGKLTLLTKFHDFQPDQGSFEYGQEFDLQLTKKIGKFTVAFKHASFFGSDDVEAGPTGIDKTVSWFFVNYVL